MKPPLSGRIHADWFVPNQYSLIQPCREYGSLWFATTVIFH